MTSNDIYYILIYKMDSIYSINAIDNMHDIIMHYYIILYYIIYYNVNAPTQKAHEVPKNEYTHVTNI